MKVTIRGRNLQSGQTVFPDAWREGDFVKFSFHQTVVLFGAAIPIEIQVEVEHTQEDRCTMCGEYRWNHRPDCPSIRS